MIATSGKVIHQRIDICCRLLGLVNLDPINHINITARLIVAADA